MNVFIPLIICRVRSRRLLVGDETIILSMRTDPEPQSAIGGVDSQCPVVSPHADRMEPPDPLEVERG